MNVIKYTSFQLFNNLVKCIDKNKASWKVRAGYKSPDGKHKTKQFILKYNGEDLKVVDNTKKLVDEVFIEFQANMNKNKPPFEYIESKEIFVKTLFNVVKKADKSKINSLLNIIEKNIDEFITSKKLNEVLIQDYIMFLKDEMQKIIYCIEDKDTNNLIFKRGVLSTSSIQHYFRVFITYIRKIVKRKATGYYPVNLENFESFDIKEKNKKEKFLSQTQIEFVEDLPTYQKLMKDRRGQWVDYDKDVKESFLFRIKSGLRQSDIARVKWNMITEQIDNNGELHTYLRIVTQKKHKPALIPLSKKTLGLLPKKRKNSEFILLYKIRKF